eukprot:scaffold60895_cov63-Phaeocystis_antarctica.AAC.1
MADLFVKSWRESVKPVCVWVRVAVVRDSKQQVPRGKASGWPREGVLQLGAIWSGVRRALYSSREACLRDLRGVVALPRHPCRARPWSSRRSRARIPAGSRNGL